MVMKVLKSRTEDGLFVERVLYTKRYLLVLDEKRCVGCEICKIACPAEAIEIIKPARIEGEKLERPTITIDENKCRFCGICSAICPFGALTLRINDEEVIPVLEKESFPQVVHEITVDETRCPVDCNECEKACPFNLVKVSVEKPAGRVRVDIEKEHCPGCRRCETKCPYGALDGWKIVSGSINIYSDRCPEGCRDCVDVCPIPGVLYVSDEGKVNVNDFCCIYCGVCKLVCPVEEALQLRRMSVRHKPVHSGAWNKALEKLTSTKDVAKELKAKLAVKTRESVRRRFS